MDTFVDILKQAQYPIVYTGAGMSTESGIPDFRSSQGLWKKYDPEQIASIHALQNNPKEFTQFYQMRLATINKYKPHEGHYILAQWEKSGLIKGIITQNVDGFHHDAGSNHVIELHGTLRSFHCHGCHRSVSPDAFLAGKVSCSNCGNVIRPNLVLFGEMLPEDAFITAEKETMRADLFIVLGSSLRVSPANIFPLQAKENNAKLIIVNHDPTPYDAYADLVIQDRSIKEVLTAVDRVFT